jgi:hypothetical protein
MSHWVYGRYKAVLNITPCDDDFSDYSLEIERGLEELDLKEFEGASPKLLFWALNGSPMTAILTSGRGQNLMKLASSVSENGGVIHLEFEDKPFEVDLEPAMEYGHRYAQTPKTRHVKASAKPQSLFIPSPFSSLSEKDYAELIPKE